MGCFDTVHFKCPNCGCALDLQSKAGIGALLKYNVKSVPMDIAMDLDGETTICLECNTVVKICIPSTVSKRIPMDVVIGTGEEWD